MALYLGLDVGSRNTKIVVFDSDANCVRYEYYTDTGVNPLRTVGTILLHAAEALQIPDCSGLRMFVTGYGRNMVKSDKVVSEISSHARGVQFVLPGIRTVIDIGGQDCKVIAMNEDNSISDFVMNDKCAAGTGRFLEMVAIRLGVPMGDLSNLAAKSLQTVSLTSTCVVFAESEIIGQISSGALPEDIIRSVHHSIADRVIAQVNQLDWKPPVAFTGGVALNNDLRDILSSRLGCEIQTPPNPEITGALGAALLAARHYEKS